MIQEFSIENTFSIKTRQTISFEAAGDTDDLHCINAGGKKLLKLAAIYGANASGKSNIIKAFDFYMDFILNSFASLKPKASIPFTPFLFDDKNQKSYGNFEIVFYINNSLTNTDIQYTYYIELNSDHVQQERLIQNMGGVETLIYERHLNATDNTYNYKYNMLVAETDQLNHIAQMTRYNASFISTSAQLNFAFLGIIHQHLDNLVIMGDKSQLGYTSNILLQNHSRIPIEDVVNILKKASVDVDDIEINFIKESGVPDFNKREIYFSHKYKKSYSLAYLDESKGTQQIFELSGLLLDGINGTKALFIDEIESSLHDDLLEFFISTFLNNSTQSQLLFTTHNQNLLDSDLLSNDEIWFVQKDETGGSELFSLVEFKDIPPDVSRRKLYKAGAFGALPFIRTFTGDK
jgi:AAA15 family ATPase/GTPase